MCWKYIDGEDTVNIMYSTEYDHRKEQMSRNNTSKHKYPCVYTISSNNDITYFYSSVKQDQFDIPKLIWTNGSIETSGSYLDANGDYCLTEFAYGIIDKSNVLKKNQKGF